MVKTAHSIYLHGGKILLDPTTRQFADAVLLQNGKVRAAGTPRELGALLGTDTEQVVLEGRTVLPGLVDAHIHLEKYALWLQMVDCELSTTAACLDAVQRRAAETRNEGWILGHGWNQNTWGAFGTLSELDTAVPDHPAYLTAKSLHAAWVNSRALQLAGIDTDTPDPEDGAIGRDADGRATGILFEGAMRMVAKHIPSPTTEQLANDIAAAQGNLAQAGLSGVHDFDGASCLSALQILRERGDLQLRILKNIPAAQLPAARELGLRTGFGDTWIRIGHIKVFADGALGPRTAAMLKPYEGEPDNRGMLLTDSEALTEIFEDAALAGFGMTVHAIGDRANHELLNAYTLLRKFENKHALPERRHRIEHLQLVHPDDLPRPAELKLVASMQPIHATSDMEMADRYWGVRVAESYAWRSQLDAGATLAFGSDAPVESPDPLAGIYAAVARRRSDGFPDSEGWVPDQRIDIKEAIAAYTIGPAFAAGTEAWQGRLYPGYAADLVVLSGDPFKLEQDQLLGLKVEATMVAGNWSFRSF